MKETLDKIITDEHLVWDSTLIDKKQQFVVDLSSEIIAELIWKEFFSLYSQLDSPLNLQNIIIKLNF